MRKFSKEHKDNLRKSHLGKKPITAGKTYEEFYGVEKGNEIKTKLIKSHLGQISLRKGKTFEEEFGKEKSDKIREKLSQKSKKMFSSEESRKKQSERIKQFVKNNPQWRELKRKQTKEFHEKYPEYKEAHSKRMKEYYSKPENKEAMIKRLKEHYSSHPETLKRMSEVSKEIWSTPEKRAYARERRIKQRFNKISKAELKVKKYLENNNINFIHQYPYKLGIADFYLPNKNLIIQCYGEYWHSKIDYINRDKIQNEWLDNNGYKVLIYYSGDIDYNKDNLNKLIPFNLIR